MNAMRDAAKKDPEVQRAWTDAVQTPITLMTGMISRLKWNDNDLKVILIFYLSYGVRLRKKMPPVINLNLQFIVKLCA